MPRLPDANDLGPTPYRAVRGSVEVPVANYAEAFGAAARGIASVGDAAAQFAQKQEERFKLQERFDTRINLLKGEQAYNEETANLDPLDPDYVAKKQDVRKKIFGPILQGVKHPENKQYFDAVTYEDYVKTGIAAGETQRDALGKKAEIDINDLTDAQLKRIDAGEDPQAVIAETNTAIDENQHIDTLTKDKLKRGASGMLRYRALEGEALSGYGKISGGAVVRAVIGAESSGDTGAVSPKGAVGLMQVMPDTAAQIAVEIKDDAFLEMSPSERQEYLKRRDVSLRYGTYYLNKMLRLYHGDLEAALVGYNAGPGNADRWLAAGRDYNVLPKKEETLPYVTKIFKALGKTPSDAMLDPRLRTSKEETLTNLRSSPMFQALPVEDQDKLIKSLDTQFDKQDKEAEDYRTQSLADDIMANAAEIDPVTGETMVNPKAAYDEADQIADPKMRKSVTSLIDLLIKRQESVQKSIIDEEEEKAYSGVVEDMRAGKPDEARARIENAKLPESKKQALRDRVTKGLVTDDDATTKRMLTGLYMNDPTGFLNATKDMRIYDNKLTPDTILKIGEWRKNINESNSGNAEAKVAQEVVKAANSKIVDKLLEIGVNPNPKAGTSDARYGNFIRDLVVTELEKFATAKAKKNEPILDSEINDVVNGVFKSYPRNKPAGGWFGSSVGADKDVDILEVTKEYEGAGFDIEAAAAKLRARGKPVNASTLLQTLETLKSIKATSKAD